MNKMGKYKQDIEAEVKEADLSLMNMRDLHSMNRRENESKRTANGDRNREEEVSRRKNKIFLKCNRKKGGAAGRYDWKRCVY